MTVTVIFTITALSLSRQLSVADDHTLLSTAADRRPLVPDSIADTTSGVLEIDPVDVGEVTQGRRTPLSNPVLDAVTRTEDAPQEANIAYFVQVADSTAAHLPRLMKRLHHPNNVYAIHFDMKMDQEVVTSVKQKLFDENPHFERNVHFMESELITYRGVSMVLNTINAMKFLLERGQDWHYFINLSGSDYPLASPATQRSLLGRHVSHKLNFMTEAAKDRWAANIDYRVQHFYVDEALSFKTGPSIVLQSSQLNPLARMMNFEYVSAEAWMINSRDFCRFLVTDGYARKMLLTFAFSVEPSEHYFSTVLWNHPEYNRTIAHRALRHVIWNHGDRVAGQHPFLVDEMQADGTYTFKEVVRDSPNFFIRKFKNANSPLMDFIDSRLNDPEHIEAVTKLYEWVTNVAIDERNAKPPLRD